MGVGEPVRRNARGDDGSVVAAEKLPSKSLSEAEVCIVDTTGNPASLFSTTGAITNYSYSRTRAEHPAIMQGCPVVL